MTTSSPSTTQYPPILIAIVVSLAAFMEVLDTTITNVSLSHIAGTLGASQDESTWVLTSYLVANGIVLPLSGWLSGVMGRKNFFMLCIAGFTAASLACGMATSMPMLIVFRLLQGLAGGGLQPVQQAIILDSFPPEKRSAAFGITGITMIVAPILGPTLGGLITDNFSWRWIFFMNVPVGIIAFTLISKMVQDPPHAQAKGFLSIDYIGLGLVALCLGALQIVLDKGQQEDWFGSSFIIGFALVSAIALVIGVAWMLLQDDPIIDLHLLKIRSFSMACLMIFITGFALYASSALMPLLVQSQFGYSATMAGLILSPGGLAVVFLMPLSGRLTGYIQARYMVCAGMLMLSIGMWATMHITPQTDYQHFVVMRILQVLGLPFLFIPISTLAFKDIPKEKSGKASALYALARNMGGSIGIAVIASYVSRHQQIHQAHLAEKMTADSPVYQTVFSEYYQAMLARIGSSDIASQLATGKLYRELIRQSSFLAYHDAYMAMAAAVVVMAVCALAMPRNNPHKKAKPEAMGH